jgi:hypothetical protein
MVQAAIEGVVDFSQAEVYSTRWHRRLGLLLSGLERQNRRELRQLLFDHAVSIYTSRKLQAEQADEIAQKVSDLYHDIQQTYYPQETEARVQHEKAMVKQDVRNWETRFGKLNSAEAKEKMDAFVQGMERLRQETADKMRSQAASQLGYLGQEMGIKPKGQQRPGKGRS